MAPRAPPVVHTYAETLVLGPRNILGREDGGLDDVDYKFVECRVNPPPLEYYYRNFSGVYWDLDETLSRESYDEAKLDRLFLNSPGTHYPCAPLQPRVATTYTNVRIDGVVRAAFHFVKGFLWRWPEPHERIYHRPTGGYIGIFLKHRLFSLLV